MQQARYERHAIWDRVSENAAAGTDDEDEALVTLAGAAATLGYKKLSKLRDKLPVDAVTKGRKVQRLGGGPADQFVVRLADVAAVHPAHHF